MEISEFYWIRNNQKKNQYMDFSSHGVWWNSYSLNLVCSFVRENFSLLNWVRLTQIADSDIIWWLQSWQEAFPYLKTKIMNLRSLGWVHFFVLIMAATFLKIIFSRDMIIWFWRYVAVFLSLNEWYPYIGRNICSNLKTLYPCFSVPC